jgi:PAS domain S-box-containing protein
MMSGFRSGQLLGSQISVLFPSSYRDGEEIESLEGFLSRNEMEMLGRPYEVVGLRRDGSTFPMDFQVTEAFLGERKVFTIMLRDVTERRESQEALRAAHSELEGRVAKRTEDLQEALSRLQEEVVQRTNTEEEREKLIGELQAALTEIKTLSGMLPICASCKKIRDDSGYWSQIEVYIGEHSDAEFSHGICPECIESLYPEFRGKIDNPEKG